MKSHAFFFGLVIAMRTVAIPVTNQDLESRSGINYISRPGYYPTFFDPFTGYPGTLPSGSNWIFDLGTLYPGGAERWGNNEYETYTSDPSNIHVTAQFTLAITPRLTTTGWTSARIETQRSDFKAKEGG